MKVNINNYTDDMRAKDLLTGSELKAVYYDVGDRSLDITDNKIFDISIRCKNMALWKQSTKISEDTNLKLIPDDYDLISVNSEWYIVLARMTNIDTNTLNFYLIAAENIKFIKS